MSDTPDNEVKNYDGALMTPRVAYTLNNYQPVRSTIIGEQPLFYMDYDDEDEGAFDEMFGLETVAEGLSSLEAHMSDLEKELAALAGDDQALTAFESGMDDITHGAGNIAVSLDELTTFMRQSRLAAAFLDFAAQHNIYMAYNGQTEKAFYDAEAGTVFLNSLLSRDELALLAVQELRRVWQDKNDAMVSPLTLHPDQAVLINRAQIADLNAVMFRVAWELQLAGKKGPWQRLAASSLNDLARSFAREAHRDFRTLNNGTACASVFESWFLSDRCQNADQDLIQKMMNNQRGYVFGDSDESAAQASRILLALGSMPYGKNYLAPYVATIIDDALFTEVRDRSSSNFLWFIKFERSFQEAEQELQAQEDISSRPFQGSASRNTQELSLDDHETNTKIIALRHDPDAARADRNHDRSGNVVPFRIG